MIVIGIVIVTVIVLIVITSFMKSRSAAVDVILEQNYQRRRRLAEFAKNRTKTEDKK